jgi:hypothetical protein
VPAPVARALTILFAVAIVALISTLPRFAPENIFVKTQSRLQIPTDVLFTRLNTLREPLGLSAADNVLRGKLVSLESRLLYLKFGPEVITDCLFCKPDDHQSYVYYAIPSVLIPHLFNLCVLALVTSGLFVGPEGAIWRRFATITTLCLATIELWYVSQSDHQANSRTTRLQDLDMFYWNRRIYSRLAIAGFDALLGWLMYLSSTNRAFVQPISPIEKVENAIRGMDFVRTKMSAAIVVKNTMQRDENLRARGQAYWVHEGRVMREAMEDKDVIEGIKNALENRIDMEHISRDAEGYAEGLVGGMREANEG